jgi:hypothetical protein
MALLSRPTRTGVGLWRLMLALLTGLGLYLPCVAAAPEYQLEAVFLFHFAEFVEWPAQAFSDAQAPLTICVLGEDPFDGYLDETVRGEKVNDRPLEVRRYRTLDQIGTCHILFISGSEQQRMGQVLAGLKGHSILTVSDSEGFERAGGMISLELAGNRIQMQVNPDAAKAADLKLSSKLLAAAKIVKADQP